MNKTDWEKAIQELLEGSKAESSFPDYRPLLAHYTSIKTLESILRGGEIWLSNPLFMNDLEEVSFGINNGVQAILQSSEIKSALSKEDGQYERFISTIRFFYKQFSEEHVMDTYVFCTSEHDPADKNGRLSMWRGYGTDGAGASIIFDTSRIPPIHGSPLKIDRVKYGTQEERRNWINDIILVFAKNFDGVILTDDQRLDAAFFLFERIKWLALFSKDKAFDEECEWRVVFSRGYHPYPAIESLLSYAITNRGVEPKLKLRLPLDGVTDPTLTLQSIISLIIVGPAHASALSVNTIKRMVQAIASPDLAERVVGSAIPYRRT